MKSSLYILTFLLSIVLISCNTKSSDTLFLELSPSKTGITFSNNLIENDSLNYFTYSYIYMGGGISAGDINNDGLVDLYFTGNMVPNKLYLNKGNMQFEDISEKAGIAGDSRWYTGTTMADVNNDGFLDIYCSVGGKFGPKENQLFINNGDNTFTDKAKDYGIDDPNNSVQATFFDYDQDGDLDLYVANYPPTPFNAPNQYYALKQRSPKPLETDHLFRRDGEKFIDVTKEAGLLNFGLSLSATVADLNEDGYPDLYVSNDFSTPDYFYKNNKDGTFSEVAKQSTKNTSFYGMGVDIADFNNDALPDILQVDMSSQINRRSKANMASMNPALFWGTVNAGFNYQYMQNSLQMNNGNLLDSLPDFSNVSRLAGVSSTDWSWGPLFADLDNDGWKDIFISNGTRREINNRDFFLKIDEKRGVPEDSTLIKTLEIPSEKVDNYVLKNNHDLTFKRVNKEWGIEHKGFSNGSVYVDLDNDGDLEIITNNIDEEATVFENTSASKNNYITINFSGPEKNNFGLGAKVFVYQNNELQFQELTLTRGFQSSVAPRMHFGLGQTKVIDSIKVIWPDQKQQILNQVAANKALTMDYKNATAPNAAQDSHIPKLFSVDKDREDLVNHFYQENYYDDFAKEILLPHQTSMFGPNIAVKDLDNNGLEDIIVGGASGFPASIYMQTKEGFTLSETNVFEEDKISEDMGILVFDAEGDGDNDIYISSGGNEFEPNSKALQDRLYLNDGKANFSKNTNGLPEMITSSGRVHSQDFDKDGDLDLFVSGRLVPGQYPTPADSYLLENVSNQNEVKFVNATPKIAPSLEKIGMVTDASWTDVDNDGWVDLVISGEWMPITVLKNDSGYFSDITENVGLEDTRGWWFSIKPGDYDNDGDIDFIAGNLGLNYKYKATEDETFDIYFNDFDKNNVGDIVLSYYNDGEKFPLRGRECSSQQMPGIKNKFKNYESFSEATLEDVYTERNLENSLHYEVKSFASAYIENKDGKFIVHKLPTLAQLSSINQILVDDYNKDGNLDALIAGNLHASEVETPRNDASNGLLLLGDGKGDFSAEEAIQSGFYAPGDVKDMASINVGNKKYIVVAKNSDFLEWITVN